MNIPQTTEGQDLTNAIQQKFDEISQLAEQRREWWYKENQAGTSQRKLAEDSGVVTQTVYTEIRKYKESKQWRKLPQNI